MQNNATFGLIRRTLPLPGFFLNFPFFSVFLQNRVEFIVNKYNTISRIELDL